MEAEGKGREAAAEVTWNRSTESTLRVSERCRVVLCRLLASGRALSDLLLTEFPPVHFDLLVYNLFEMQEFVIGKQLNFVRES